MKFSVCTWAITATAALLIPQLARAGHADNYDVTCPPLLDANAVNFVTAKVPGDWQPYMPLSLDVRLAYLMYGPPESQRQAVPLSRTDGPRASITKWDFSDIPNDEKWLSCGYGRGGELTLSRPLPRDVSICTVTAKKGDHGWISAVGVSCKPLPK